MLRRVCLASLLIFLPLTAFAQNADEIGWTGEIELNGSNTTGNNETTNVGTKVRAKHRGTDWRHDFAGSADYGEANDQSNKRRMRISYKIGRDLGERSYLFANSDYYSDDFGAFKNGYFVGGGYGYTVVPEGDTFWKLEAGAGYRSQKARLTQNAPNDPISRQESFASARLFSELSHQLNDSVSFENDSELFYSSIDTYIINETSVTSDMFGALSLRASFRIESHSDVPDGREKTDTVSRIGIVYTLN